LTNQPIGWNCSCLAHSQLEPFTFPQGGRTLLLFALLTHYIWYCWTICWFLFPTFIVPSCSFPLPIPNCYWPTNRWNFNWHDVTDGTPRTVNPVTIPIYLVIPLTPLVGIGHLFPFNRCWHCHLITLRCSVIVRWFGVHCWLLDLLRCWTDLLFRAVLICWIGGCYFDFWHCSHWQHYEPTFTTQWLWHYCSIVVLFDVPVRGDWIIHWYYCWRALLLADLLLPFHTPTFDSSCWFDCCCYWFVPLHLPLLDYSCCCSWVYCLLFCDVPVCSDPFNSSITPGRWRCLLEHYPLGHYEPLVTIWCYSQFVLFDCCLELDRTGWLLPF